MIRCFEFDAVIDRGGLATDFVHADLRQAGKDSWRQCPPVRLYLRDILRCLQLPAKRCNLAIPDEHIGPFHYSMRDGVYLGVPDEDFLCGHCIDSDPCNKKGGREARNLHCASSVADCPRRKSDGGFCEGCERSNTKAPSMNT